MAALCKSFLFGRLHGANGYGPNPIDRKRPTGRQDFTNVRTAVETLRTAIGNTIVGQDQMVELLMVAMLARGHVLIEGYPGLAKTLTAKLIAKSI
jgi:MoxR-like ATPase